MLRKRIQELQHYRRMGLTTPADIEKFELDSLRRVRDVQQSICHNRLLTRAVDSSKSKYFS